MHKKIQIVDQTEDGYIRVEKEDLLEVSYDFDMGFVVDGNCRPLAVRGSAELKGKAFFLNDAFDWVIVRDSGGNACLVPTGKESGRPCIGK